MTSTAASVPDSPQPSNPATALNSSPDGPPSALVSPASMGHRSSSSASSHQLHIHEQQHTEEQEIDLADYVKLFVSNISSKVDESKLATLVDPVQPVDIQLCDDVSPMYALMFFESDEEAIEAYNKLQGLLFGGLTMRASLPPGVQARARSNLPPKIPTLASGLANKIIDPTCNLYVKNLDAGVDEKVLYYLFTAFGEIVSVRIVRDPAGVHKGYGFVLYNSPASATSAQSSMNHRKVGPRKIVCAVSNKDSFPSSSSSKENTSNGMMGNKGRKAETMNWRTGSSSTPSASNLRTTSASTSSLSNGQGPWSSITVTSLIRPLTHNNNNNSKPFSREQTPKSLPRKLSEMSPLEPSDREVLAEIGIASSAKEVENKNEKEVEKVEKEAEKVVSDGMSVGARTFVPRASNPTATPLAKTPIVIKNPVTGDKVTWTAKRVPLASKNVNNNNNTA